MLILFLGLIESIDGSRLVTFHVLRHAWTWNWLARQAPEELAAVATWQLVHPHHVNRMSGEKVEMVLADFAKKFLRLRGNDQLDCFTGCAVSQ
ncbi:MAG TPA: hypothetical protein PK667_00955 [Nitrosomonas europaea]|uniref:hypothetical protein n=1 Tax=Nitrosomonas europaea TaxID=915 RepID=UPI0024923D48|nr:hypothetical protein [Nitrosomonas europaea]HRN80908.1 hypothetical protein [Nitrosomonas europaea]HRO55230.1 hypothetical protein [Nitrosomonas europaea]HRQ07516.1 hypothetical protein [Nitrosomonas europaea]HUM72748.1 hypothetical protein [Nitrosomonas europaea]